MSTQECPYLDPTDSPPSCTAEPNTHSAGPFNLQDGVIQAPLRYLGTSLKAHLARLDQVNFSNTKDARQFSSNAWRAAPCVMLTTTGHDWLDECKYCEVWPRMVRKGLQLLHCCPLKPLQGLTGLPCAGRDTQASLKKHLPSAGLVMHLTAHPRFPHLPKSAFYPSPSRHPTRPHHTYTSQGTIISLPRPARTARTRKNTMDCYICRQMSVRKPQHKQDGPSKICLLCNNRFCEKHKGGDEGVCEMNHDTYCSKTEHQELHAPVKIYTTLAERRERLGGVQLQCLGRRIRVETQ